MRTQAIRPHFLHGRGQQPQIPPSQPAPPQAPPSMLALGDLLAVE
ncbi:hypothetical protein A2U01_0095448, partial [Trifolium medium]|nr:hypothetical protein [Trifolium medium]